MIHLAQQSTPPVAFAIKQLEESIDKLLNAPSITISTNPAGMTEQSYRLNWSSNEALNIVGADDAGTMYGILDVAEKIRLCRSFDRIDETTQSPYIMNRGIKLNIPLDSRTPSYSDSGDSAVYNIANMWDAAFWESFLDRMALQKYNVLSLWSLSPFPSLVRVPEYPAVALEDVKRTTRPFCASLEGPGISSPDIIASLITVKKMRMEDKIAFWRWVMEYAQDRAIKIYLFTWNLFTYGTEGNPYGITCDQNNPITKDYLYCSVKAIIKTYPLLAGIGVTAGENMLRSESDELFLRETYGRGIEDALVDTPHRPFSLIHRMQYSALEPIEKVFSDFKYPMEVSFKYSQAHMYANAKPTFIDWFLPALKENRKIWLTVRNDDFYMYRWGDVTFAREYLSQMPASQMLGFYMGPDGYTWGREYISVGEEENHPLVIEKMWYMFALWGQLAYNPTLPDAHFVQMLAHQFGDVDAELLHNTWQQASRIIPEFQCVHFHDFDFQWYPEGCCLYENDTDKFVFGDINEFIACDSAPGAGYLSVGDYCNGLVRQSVPEGISPLEMAKSIRLHARQAMEGVAVLEPGVAKDSELQRTLEDIKALAYLGDYLATKLEAAVQLLLYRLTQEAGYQAEAVTLLQCAVPQWKRYSAQSRRLYRPQTLTRMKAYVDVERFDELSELDVLLAAEG